MKIEIGESLCYSWLRHVKKCQIVQTNWKVSSQWDLHNEEVLNAFMETSKEHFNSQYGYNIFKQNRSLSQIIKQGECDAIGISVQNGVNSFYAVDVAFHRDGLIYETSRKTVMKIIAKSIRTAMILYGYMESNNAEVIFASPKISPSILNDLAPCIEDVNNIFAQYGLHFSMCVIANEEFNELLVQPILRMSDKIKDTSELFLRSYQMLTMFADKK